MAFWGIEVKPGKPYTHLFDRVRGRLRISQATLGIGSSTKKSLVQCNVGDRSPVFLCALLPDKTESCHLDLEFEEGDEVVFSVIGPRSVHLTGYHVGIGRPSIVNDDTESYGEDIANSGSEESVRRSAEDDEYEDSFIDDGDPEVCSSPVSSSRMTDEEILDKTKQRDKKVGRKRLKKKYQSVVFDDEKTSLQQNIGNDSKHIPEPDSAEEDFFFNSSLCRGKTNAKDVLLDAEEKADKEIWETVNQRTEDDTESKRIANAVVIDGDPRRGAELGSEDGPKRKKRRKEQAEACSSNHGNVLNEECAKQDEATTGKGSSDPSVLNNQNPESENGKSIDIDSNLLAGGSQSKEKKPKKKKKSKSMNNNENVNADATLLLNEENNIPDLVMEDKKVDAKSSLVRTLSSGLIIEELQTGKADGKIAVSGKKVKVHYTGRLKENGKVFDSNVGEAPFRFRLGAEDIIEGWNIGLDGMRVGEKRRLVIPPSMGYGSGGVGENVPPNSWLVYDIELLGVR